MILPIWQRYFLSQFIKIFALFLFCFYSLYILIDYSSHSHHLLQNPTQIHWKETLRYYFFIFSARAEILLPLALIIAFIQTSCSLNTSQELAALMSGGLDIRKLMRPFLFVALVCLGFLFVNEQWILPKALKKIRRIEDATKHQKSKNKLDIAVHHLHLEDGSLFIYQRYDTIKKHFIDAYWIASINQIYRMKYLSAEQNPPLGSYVDLLMREANGELLQQVSFTSIPFPQMKFNKQILQSTLLDPEALSLSDLYQLLKKNQLLSSDTPNQAENNLLNDRDSRLLTSFLWKLLIPFLCLLAILVPAPFCVRFSRQVPVFLIYVCSLFGLIAFYMFLDALQVVAKKQVLNPFWALCFPFLSIFVYSLARYRKLGISR